MKVIYNKNKSIGFLKLLYKDITKSNRIYWICECVCGTILSIRQDNLLHKHDCGCFKRELKLKSEENNPSRLLTSIAKRKIYYKITRDLFKEIRNRDNNQCVLCHKKDDLHIHHILKKSTHIKYIASSENLITLCEDCHLNKAHPNNTHFIDLDLAQKLLYISFINSLNYSISQEIQKILINKLQKYLKIIL